MRRLARIRSAAQRMATRSGYRTAIYDRGPGTPHRYLVGLAKPEGWPDFPQIIETFTQKD